MLTRLFDSMPSNNNLVGSSNNNSRLSMSSATVEDDDVLSAAQFILLCKRGNTNAAIEFLKRTLAEVDGSGLDMNGLITSLGSEIVGIDALKFPSRSTSHPPLTVQTANGTAGAAFVRTIDPMSFVGDDLDKAQTSIVILIPGEMHVVGHVIGKGGVEITKIETESGAQVKIESYQNGSTPKQGSYPMTVGGTAPLERTVIISGPLTSCIIAQRMLDMRVRARLENDGIHREVLRIVVPNEFVRHLIGKSGSNITNLQAQAGIRIQVQAEASMLPAQIGRAVTFQGPEHGRSLAQYLVARQIAEGPYREWPSLSNSPKTSAATSPTANHTSPTGFTIGNSSESSVSSSSLNGSNMNLFDDNQNMQRSYSNSNLFDNTMDVENQEAIGSMIRALGTFTSHGSNGRSAFSSSFQSPSTYSSPAPPTASPQHNFFSALPAPQQQQNQHQQPATTLPYVSLGSFSDDEFGTPEIVRTQVNIPNSSISFVFGKGNAMSDLEHRFNASISIVSKDSQNHVLAVRGAQSAVRNLQKVLQSRIDYYFMAQSGGGLGGPPMF